MRTISRLLGVGAACVMLSVTGQAQDAEVDSVAERAVSQFVSSWNASAAGDARGYERYRDLYWPDADLVDPTGLVWKDQAGIVQMHVDLWNTAFKGSVVKGVVRRARRISPTVMIADFDLELALFKQAPSGSKVENGVVKAHLKMVMQKRDASWRVVSSQNTFYGNPPAPATTQ